MLRGLIDLGSQKVRCTRCGHRFVPLVDDGLETQVINWLDDDTSTPPPPGATPPQPKTAAVTQRPTAKKDAPPESPPQQPKAKDKAAPKEKTPEEKPFAPAAKAPDSDGPPAKSKPAEKPSKLEARSMAYRKRDGKTKYKVVSALKTSGDVPEGEQRINLKPANSTVNFDPLKDEEQAEDEFSHVERQLVQLLIEEMSGKGVRLIFNVGLLKIPSFRASVPMACVLCGKDDKGSLLARPMMFIDRCKDDKATVGELETTYQINVKQGWDEFDVVKSMISMDKFPPPMSEPLAYYVCKEHIETSLKCRTLDTGRGLYCRTTIPSARLALGWLSRVNGIVDRHFVRLHDFVRRTEGGAWAELSETVRQKISAWFEFEGDEQFLGYYMDTDFMVKDAGLAGIVVTDHRIVYCKYQKKGSIQLMNEGDLVGTEFEAFFDLLYRTSEKTTKLVQLRKKDTEELMSTLAELTQQGRCKLRLLRG